jgi:outer membrane murein-binding lipoprotein Lpp
MSTVHTDTELTELFTQCMFEQTTIANQHSTELTLALAREMFQVITHQIHSFTEESVEQKIASISAKSAVGITGTVGIVSEDSQRALLDVRIDALASQLQQLESTLTQLQNHVNTAPDAFGALKAVFGNLCESTHATLSQYSTESPQLITSGTHVKLQQLGVNQLLITVSFSTLPTNAAVLTLTAAIPLPLPDLNSPISYLYTGDLTALANTVANVTGDETYTFIIPPVNQYPVSFNFN